MPDHVAGVLAFVVIAEGELRVQATHFLIHLRGQEEGKEIVLEEFLLNHVVEDWCDTSLCKIGISHTDDCIEVLAEDAVLLLNVSELLVLDKYLGS